VGRDDGSGAGRPKRRAESKAYVVVPGEEDAADKRCCRAIIGAGQGRGERMNRAGEEGRVAWAAGVVARAGRGSCGVGVGARADAWLGPLTGA
jgi:hypothetical protein